MKTIWGGSISICLLGSEAACSCRKRLTYLTGALYGRPLARLRETLRHLGIEKAAERSEPEDHAAILCEIMAGLVGGGIAAPAGADREFFEKHLAPWIRRFFVDLEHAESADFYARVGSLGRTFIEVEMEAFALSAQMRMSGSLFENETFRSGEGAGWLRKTGEDAMREFIVACLVAGIIAAGAAVILDNYVQEPVSVAFAEPGVRV
jgi:hypothetical protein